MQTSRKEGLLVLNTKTPYKMAKSGTLSDATEIICKEITYSTEGIAFDIEQMFYNAMIDIAGKSKNFTSGGTAQENDSGYDTKEKPTDDEIDENAKQIEVLFKMNSAGKMSELMTMFEGLVNAGLILAEGGTLMTSKLPPWTSINRQDKAAIMFKYISFFVKPLSALSEISQTQKAE